MFTHEERRELDEAIALLRSMSAGALEAGLLEAAASAERALGPTGPVPTEQGKDAYQTLVEQIPAVTFFAPLDDPTNRLYVSPQIEQLLGYDQREWIEDPVLWYERLHPDDKQRWTSDAAATFSLGTPLDGTYRFLARDGSVVWIRGHVKIVRDVAGKPTFIHGVGFDVTETKLAELERARLQEELEIQVANRTLELSRAQRDLQRYAGELKRSNEDLEQFAYIASHDLQEPLRTLTTFSQLLEEDLQSSGELSEDNKRYLQFIADASRYMSQLVADLLTFSRVGRAELSKAPTDLNRLVADVMQLLGDSVKRSGASVTVEPMGEVLADERLLAQVLQNLIANAIKFSDTGSPEVHVGFERRGDSAVIAVRDNGIGIDARHFDVIFAPFQRLHKKRFEGTGIGLAICKKIVELHGGRLWVESQPGEGAQFFVSLPV